MKAATFKLLRSGKINSTKVPRRKANSCQPTSSGHCERAEKHGGRDREYAGRAVGRAVKLSLRYAGGHMDNKQTPINLRNT